jgi:protein-tyrosine phosphatase
MPSVLFVCTANRFRSPLAEAIFKQCLDDAGCQEGWDVSSAGTWVESGLPAYPTAARAAKGMGLDIHSHRTQPVTAELLLRMDLIIVMEAGHAEAIQIEFPESARKTILMSEIVKGFSYDIPDPFDPIVDSQQALAEEVCHLVKMGYNKIYAKAGKCEKLK